MNYLTPEEIKLKKEFKKEKSHMLVYILQL
jgi:hypothetical protein